MQRHVKSVLKLIDVSSKEPDEVVLIHDSSKVELPTPEGGDDIAGERPAQSQPRPQTVVDFDRVVSASSEADTYAEYVKDLVESVLLGYHGTVISFGSSACRRERTENLEAKGGLIQSAAAQILRCLKLSGKSNSKSPITSNLVLQCSYVLLQDEKARDLLSGYALSKETSKPTLSQLSILKEEDGELVNVSYCTLSSIHRLRSVLKYGQERINAVKSFRSEISHSIFTLSVEFKQFGTTNAPISGVLSFVCIADSDDLTEHKSSQLKISSSISNLSLFTFADVIEAHALKSASQREEEDLYSSAMQATPSEICSQSLLTRILRESLGGNCKTILITFFPSKFPIDFCPDIFLVLKVASQAKMIENKPNKKELAEKALMSAYMKGLEERYGRSESNNNDGKGGVNQTNDRDSNKHTYMEMLEATSEEAR